MGVLEAGAIVEYSVVCGGRSRLINRHPLRSAGPHRGGVIDDVIGYLVIPAILG